MRGKMRSKYYGKKSYDEKEIQLDWFASDEDSVSPLNKNLTRRLQHDRNRNDDGSRSRSQYRSTSSSRTTQTTSQSGNLPRIRRTKKVLEGRTTSQSSTKEPKIIKFSLNELRENISDEILQSLINYDFNPDKLIIIRRYMKQTPTEDQFINQTLHKITHKTTRKVKTPSDKLGSYRAKYLRKQIEANSQVVLSYYFKLYKELFGEDDPEWTKGNLREPLAIITRLANEQTKGNYEILIGYTKRMLPLWCNQLKNGAEFPNRRPTVSMLYGGKRFFWSNRNILYRQWQQR